MQWINAVAQAADGDAGRLRVGGTTRREIGSDLGYDLGISNLLFGTSCIASSVGPLGVVFELSQGGEIYRLAGGLESTERSALTTPVIRSIEVSKPAEADERLRTARAANYIESVLAVLASTPFSSRQYVTSRRGVMPS